MPPAWMNRDATFHSAREVAGYLERAGSMKETDPVGEGHGEGCFVAVKAEK